MGEQNYSISSFFLKINQLLWKNSFLQKSRSMFYYVDSVLLLGLRKKYIRNKNIKKKVLIVYNMALGDGVMFLGVAENIRDIYPSDQYELTLTCQSAFEKLYEKTGIFDKVLPFDFAGAVVNLKNRRKLFHDLRKEVYDIVLDPIGCDNCTTNVFVTRAVIARENIGVIDSSLPHIQCPKWMQKKIYTRLIRVETPNMHLIQFYAEFFKALGARNCVAHPADFKKIELNMMLPKRFFIIFPTASMGVKRWPLTRYAFLARNIQEKTGMPLLVCGTDHDRPVISEFLSLIPDVEFVDVIGKTDIHEFIELIGRAELVVTNDTSAYHIAVAQQVDVALICGGYTYSRYAKYNYSKLGYKDPVLICKKMICYDCNNYCKYNNCDIFPCIKQITQEDAWEIIEKMIG